VTRVPTCGTRALESKVDPPYIVRMDNAPHQDPLAAALVRKSQAGAAGRIRGRAIAAGDGWQANDFICTCGPGDHDTEERSSMSGVALLLSGSFVARDRHGTSLLSEGSLFLVEAGHCFVCSHRHGAGDRCLSFQFEPEVFERIAHDVGAAPGLARNSLPPLRELARLAARARLALEQPGAIEEVAFALTGAAMRLAGSPRGARASAHHHGRMTEVVRYMAEHPAAPHKLAGLARMARMSPYHFLRSFKATTGVTPHQWLLRARLHRAATQLATSHVPVTDIALEVGFEDLSNFTRTFRAEFGASPRQYRLAA
jgi:AraC-like DNA-binding protein